MAETARPLQPTVPERPVLTLPAAEAAALRAAYGAAGVILEYGSGGSTVLASELPGKQIFSVETDADWLAALQAYLQAHPGLSPVVLHHADIGPTKAWGHPVDDSRKADWRAYPHSVWERADFQHPDVVLIDGRFRAASFVAVATRITRPVTVLFDDYTPRPTYHSIERLAQPVELIGRMARFELSPMVLPEALQSWLADLTVKPL